VRFATKRFIGEYDCTTDRIYRVDNHLGTSWEIADPPGYPLASAEPKLRWADAIVLVYSVTDRVSFDETSRLRYVTPPSHILYIRKKRKCEIALYDVVRTCEVYACRVFSGFWYRTREEAERCHRSCCSWETRPISLALRVSAWYPS